MTTPFSDTTPVQLGDGSLQEHAAVLRTFALLLSSHLHYTSKDRVPTTSQKCIQKQHAELCLLFAGSSRDEKQISLCYIPCLQLRKQNTGSTLTEERSFCDRPSDKTATTIAIQSLSSSSLEHDTAENLARRIAIGSNEISNLPSLILTNLSATFETLWQARMRQTVKALVSRGSTARDEINARLLAKLATQPHNAIVSTFETLDFVDQFKAQVNEEDVRGKASKIVVPVIFNVVMDFTFFDRSLIVSTSPIQAPGILIGQFSTAHERKLVLECVDLELDTKSLLSAMMKEVKLLVRKAMLVVADKTRHKVGLVTQSVPMPICGSGTMASGMSLHQLVGTDTRRVEGSTTNLSIEPASTGTSDLDIPDENNVDFVDDEQEAMAEEALILAAKTPLQVLFETGIFDAVTDDAPPSVGHLLLSPSHGSSTTGLAEHPNMPPPPKRAPSVDALLSPDTASCQLSRKRP